jgi:hypothetical protein
MCTPKMRAYPTHSHRGMTGVKRNGTSLQQVLITIRRISLVRANYCDNFI